MKLKIQGFAKFMPGSLAGLCLLGGAALPAGNAAAEVIAGPVVNPANGHRYYLLGPNNWTASEAEAVKLGGHLVTINDSGENDWVYSQFSYANGNARNLWTGLKERASGGKFVWANGEALSYTNWSSGEPYTSADSACVLMLGDYDAKFWEAVGCDGSGPYGVVEISSNLKITAFTASPTAGGAPLKVDFTARAITDAGARITQYIWDLNGDTYPDKITYVGKLSNTYKTAGVYNATVQVVESSGYSAVSNKLKVTVGAAPELYGKIEYYAYDDATRAARVKLRVYNSGLANAKSFKVGLVLSDGGQGPAVVKTVSVNSLNARSNVLLDFSHTFPESIHGRTLAVAVDADKQIGEVDEANNTLNISVGTPR